MAVDVSARRPGDWPAPHDGDWPEHLGPWARWYTAWIVGVSGGHTRLCVEKRSGRDGITWDTLQQIKNDMLGPNVVCVEVYPAHADVVNEVNRRHLWVLPDAPNFIRGSHNP